MNATELSKPKLFEYLREIALRLEVKQTKCLKGLYRRMLEVINYGKMLTVKGINIDSLIERIESVFDSYGFIDFEGKPRKHALSRQVLATLIYDNTNFSLRIIGEKYMGGKTHATVLHAHKVIDNLMSTNKRFKLTYESIMIQFGLKYYKYVKNERKYSDKMIKI